MKVLKRSLIRHYDLVSDALVSGLIDLSYLRKTEPDIVSPGSLNLELPKLDLLPNCFAEFQRSLSLQSPFQPPPVRPSGNKSKEVKEAEKKNWEGRLLKIMKVV
jgi:hypothetical protein